MRIIKKGTKQQPVFRGTCSNCGCEFEEDKDKLIVEDHQLSDGPMAKVRCPQCDKDCWIYQVKNKD